MKAEFARLGPVRAISRVRSGSRARFALTLTREGWPALNSIAATMALSRRGLTMLAAKKTVEDLIRQSSEQAEGHAIVLLPMTDTIEAVISDLAKAGIRAIHVDHKADVDVALIRRRLKLSRRQFALWYGLEEETIKGWESGERTPDTAAKSYLRAISNRPEAVREAYAHTK
ncbi:hypothetical protein K6W40_15350 [Acetobacter senegalensis]|nr:hypothetical protein [Acetobacter senegalensis]